MSVFEAVVVSGGGLLIILVLWKMFRFAGGVPTGERDHFDLPSGDGD